MRYLTEAAVDSGLKPSAYKRWEGALIYEFTLCAGSANKR